MGEQIFGSVSVTNRISATGQISVKKMKMSVYRFQQNHIGRSLV